MRKLDFESDSLRVAWGRPPSRPRRAAQADYMYYDNRLMLIKADRVYAHFLKVQFTVGKMGAHKAAVIELDAS